MKSDRIGVLVQILDDLPPTIGHAIFVFLWLVFLLKGNGFEPVCDNYRVADDTPGWGERRFYACSTGDG